MRFGSITRKIEIDKGDFELRFEVKYKGFVKEHDS